MLQLYAPLTKSGIIDLVYSMTGADATKYPLMEVTRDINLAKANLAYLAQQASGVNQADDANHTDYPIIYLDLKDGQRDYSFTTDEQGNQVQDIYRVMVANADGVFYDLVPVDQYDNTSGYGPGGMVDGKDREGNPTMYDKTANGIFLDLIPDYDYTNGIKIFISREPKKFSVPTVNVADTTTSGFDARVDEYLAIRPAYYYAFRKNLNSKVDLRNELIKYEGDEKSGLTGKIQDIYGQRVKDERPKFSIMKYLFR